MTKTKRSSGHHAGYSKTMLKSCLLEEDFAKAVGVSRTHGANTGFCQEPSCSHDSKLHTRFDSAATFPFSSPLPHLEQTGCLIKWEEGWRQKEKSDGKFWCAIIYRQLVESAVFFFFFFPFPNLPFSASLSFFFFFWFPGKYQSFSPSSPARELLPHSCRASPSSQLYCPILLLSELRVHGGHWWKGAKISSQNKNSS